MRRVHRRIHVAALGAVAALSVALLSCQREEPERAELPEKSEQSENEVSSMAFKLTSPAFQDGETIPEKYTCVGEDVSPPLMWEDVPEGTRSFALVMEDPDAPGGTFVHWVIFNIPGDAAGLPEGVEPLEKLENGAVQGANDFRRLGYGGPCPPPGKPHRYYFILWALDRELSLGPGVTKDRLELEIEKFGGPLGEARLMGTFGR